MPDFIAIDWEKQQFCGVEADVSKERVRIRKCFTLPWPDELDLLTQPQQAGEWLKDQLAELGVSAKQALVALPREDAVVRHLELPDVPDAELPDLVQFQASTKSTLPLAQMHLDFLPLPPRDGFAGRDVLMATISTQKADTIRSVLTAAGLELVSLTITPTATAELVVRVGDKRGRKPHDAAGLVIARHGDRVEISVIRDRHLLATHSTLLSEEDSDSQTNQSILAEISRTFVALQNRETDFRISQVWVLGSGDENGSLVAALKQRLSSASFASKGCDVQTIDPLAESGIELKAIDVPGHRALYAGPVGMLLASTGAAVQGIDFLKPRKPVVKRDRRIYRAALYTAAALLISGLIYGTRYFLLGAYDIEIAQLSANISDMEESIKKQQPEVESAALVEQWVDKDVHWLDRLTELTELMGGTERYYIRYLDLNQGSRDTLGKIDADGVSKARVHVESLNAELVKHESYAPRSSPITRTSDDADYPYRFQLDVDLKRLEKQLTQTTKVNGGKTARPSKAVPRKSAARKKRGTS